MRIRAAIGSLVFLAMAPGVVGGLVPWLLTGWAGHDRSLLVRLLGGAMIAFGLAFLLPAFIRFVLEGLGTPAPVAQLGAVVVAAR
jgi:hypothetical protein